MSPRFFLVLLSVISSPCEIARAENPIPIDNNYRPYYRRPRPQPQPQQQLQPETVATSPRRPASEVVPEEGGNAWSPEKANFSVGYERAGVPFPSNPTSALSQNAVVFGGWVSKDIGIEGFLGLTKNDETASAQHNETGDTPGTTKTTTDTFTPGTTDPLSLIIGGTVKARLVQNSWFQFYVGGILGLCPGAKSTNDTGTRTQAFPALATHPGSYTETDTNIGSQIIERKTYVFVGPKLGTEFYLKWIPHLALGFSTGILTTFGGDVTTSVSTESKTVLVTDGVAGTPTGDTKTSTTSTTKQPFRAGTFGVGGSNFQFNGIFTLRYIW